MAGYHYPIFNTPGVSADSEGDGSTALEYAADVFTSQLLTELTDTPAEVQDPTAYICWYCARPFIGRMSFYMHMLQEALAIPGEILNASPYPWFSLDNCYMIDGQICEQIG